MGVLAQSTEARCEVENKDVVRAAPNKKKQYLEESRCHKKSCQIRKQSMQEYLQDLCDKNDFWASINPFFSDKRFRNGHNIFIRENNKVVPIPVMFPNFLMIIFHGLQLILGLTTALLLLQTQFPPECHENTTNIQ